MYLCSPFCRVVGLVCGQARFGSLHGSGDRLVCPLRPRADNFRLIILWEVETPAENSGDPVECPSCVCLVVVGTKILLLSVDLKRSKQQVS